MDIQFWRIAGLTLSVRWHGQLSCLEDGNLGWDRSFRVSANGSALILQVRPRARSRWQEPGAEDWVFTSAGVWAAFRREDGWGFISPAPSAGEWQRLLVWSPQRRQARLYVNPSLFSGLFTEDRPHFDPLQNLTLPFFTALFARHQGLLVHAAAVEVDGRAWLFVGPSGSGKSHWTRQWQERGVTVLDEDRVVLRLLDGQVWAFGTPWHAEPRLCSLWGKPLERVFFLRQAESDAVREEIRPVAAMTLLIRSLQLPIYDPEGTQAVLDVAEQAVVQSRSFLVGRMTDKGLLDRLAMQ